MESTVSKSLDDGKISSCQNSKSYDLPKNILYLGLEITECIDTITNLIVSSLKEITYEYEISDASKLIKLFEENIFECSENYKNPWKYPKESKIWHVTTLFKSGKSFIKSHPAYLYFQENKDVQLEIRGLVYIPNKIITSIIYTESPIQNEFPHMTTLLAGYSAKNSNDVCKELFSEGKELRKSYLKLMKEDYQEEGRENEIKRIQVKILGKEETVFFIKYGYSIGITSKMRMFSY
jgi:hypothetical protein